MSKATEIFNALNREKVNEISTRYKQTTEQKAKLLTKKVNGVNTVATRLSKLKEFSNNDEEKVHIIFDKLTDIDNELVRISA